MWSMKSSRVSVVLEAKAAAGLTDGLEHLGSEIGLAIEIGLQGVQVDGSDRIDLEAKAIVPARSGITLLLVQINFDVDSPDRGR